MNYFFYYFIEIRDLADLFAYKVLISAKYVFKKFIESKKIVEMSSFFTLVDLDSVQSRASRFKYTCCDLFRDYIAFGTSAGTIHIYKSPFNSPPIVISFSSLINAVILLVFSPNGKWLILGDAKGLHFIEDPLTSASLFFSIDMKGNQATSVQWICEPPPKINRNLPYVFAGDDAGSIWLIRHQNSDLFTTLPGGINQLSIIDDTKLLAATQKGPILISHVKIENKLSSSLNHISYITSAASTLSSLTSSVNNNNNNENNNSAHDHNNESNTNANDNSNDNSSAQSPDNVYGVHTTPIGRKSPTGDFGGLYANEYKAILLSRPDGKLSLASLEGKIKVTLKFAAEGLEINPENQISPDLHYLMLCPPFLISAGSHKLCYIIDLSPTPPKLVSVLPDFSDVIGFSSDKTRVLFLSPNKISLFSVCENPIVYVNYLIKKQMFIEAQETVIEQKIADESILAELKDKTDNHAFRDYVEKLELMNKPQPLSDVDSALFSEFLSVSIPTPEMMSKLYELRSLIVIDEQIKKKIEAYVINDPVGGIKWIDEIDPDYIVPIVNDREEAAQFVQKASKLGNSELCKMIAKLDSMPIEVCVANSPPLRAHNFTGERRKEFEKVLSEVDMFECNVEEPQLVDSLYFGEYTKITNRILQSKRKKANHSNVENKDVNNNQNNIENNNNEDNVKLEELDDDDVNSNEYESVIDLNQFSEDDFDITPEETHRLLQIYEWERQISECVAELRSKLEMFMISQGSKTIPPWLKSAIISEKNSAPQAPIDLKTLNESGPGNWGVVAHLTICPVCGMQHNLGESVTSVSVFPCSHMFHVACLHQRYCPICYSNCMQ